MKSATLGIPTSLVEVTNISEHGFWLLIAGDEKFLPYANFPWFKNATVAQLLHVEHPSKDHLYWPDLDIDLSVDSIDNPQAYPLVSKV
ncbi:MAG: DUF2442 domain-containing protein [Dokdonella sp.]